MLHFELDTRNAAPAYRQLMDQVGYYVASQTLATGAQLPSIRELARYLGVNPSTVVKAYTELEHEGLIERRQGKGVFVRASSASERRLSSGRMEAALRESARRLALEATQLGAKRELVLRVVRDELNEMSKKAKESSE